MYPPRFAYLAPTSVEEVVAALGEQRRGQGDGRRAEPDPGAEAPRRLRGDGGGHQRRPGLDGIEEDGELRIGALVRHAQARAVAAPHQAYGLLGSTARLVADPLVRNRGTICGSLAHADPQGDWGAGDARRARAASSPAGRTASATIAVDELALGPFIDDARAGRGDHRGARARSGAADAAGPT